MSGLVFASLAMLSVIHDEIRWMWLWLALAMIVDGVDGTCARRARVKEVIPWFDGGVLNRRSGHFTKRADKTGNRSCT